MASNRGFIWLDNFGSGSGSSLSFGFDGSSITMDNTSVIDWAGGSTFLTNNSITTTNFDVDLITNSGNPVAFPDGIISPDIYFNNAYEYTPENKMIH